MTTIESTQQGSLAAVDATRAALDQVHAQLNEAVRDGLAKRKALIDSCREELEAAGHETAIVYEGDWDGRPPAPDDIQLLAEEYETRPGRRTLRRWRAWPEARLPRYHAGEVHFWGTASQRNVRIDRGRYRVVFVAQTPLDEHVSYDVLLVKEADPDSESGHKSSVARLRNLARHDALRVRVRDQDVHLIDPLDNIVHSGDVLSAFAYLLNIDVEKAEWPADGTPLRLNVGS